MEQGFNQTLPMTCPTIKRTYLTSIVSNVDKGISLVTLIKDVEHAMEQERDKRIKDKSLESMIH